MNRALAVVSLAVGCALTSACASEAAERPAHAAAAASDPWAGITEAVAMVHPTKGNNCHGVVRFTQVDGGVSVVADIEGLKPNSKHGFHIHEFGDCTSADGKSAGGHYNPEGVPHGGPDADKHHPGDLGNLEADAKGRARYERMVHGATIAGAIDPILGRSVIIHAGEDDLTTQPTGNAGDRIGCGVIGVAKPAAK